jgi:hypothetical protein
MKKFFWFTLVWWSLFACQHPSSNGSRSVTGRIIGLKKGTVYLNTVEENSLKVLDSVTVKGNDNFHFDISAYSPQLMALSLKEKPGDYLIFFSDDTAMYIETELNRFGIAKKISGGRNYGKWLEYKEMLSQYNDKKLEVIEKQMNSYKQKDTSGIRKAENELLQLEKRMKMYALNFGNNNKNLPVGAYVAYIHLKDNPRLLDTLFRNAGESFKQSVYGRKIRKILEKTQK